jgi:aspartate/tyrosine/aromatic aminotransferase
MFALLRMSRTQIETVRRAHGICMVDDGRINVAVFQRGERRLSARQFSMS